MRLERNFFVWNCTSLVAFIGSVSSIAVASRVEELDPVHVDKVPIILSACFLVLPRLSALAAFQINTAAFVEILANDFSSPPKCFHCKPLSTFLEFAIPVLPTLGTGDRELCDD